MIGWIKISREIPNHWIWKDATKLKWWLDMLITVNFKDNKVMIGNQLFECKRGQSIMSLQSWADRWIVDKNKVRNFFILLEKDGMILHENLSKTTRITICNYDTYQTLENANETQTKRKRNANETQPNAIEEREEEIKNINKINNSPYGDGRLHFKCIKYAEQNPDKYPKEFYVSFLEYWTAKIQKGPKNGQELWTDEKAFAVGSRLSTSFKMTWDTKKGLTQSTPTVLPQRQQSQILEPTEQEKLAFRKANGLL